MMNEGYARHIGSIRAASDDYVEGYKNYRLYRNQNVEQSARERSKRDAVRVLGVGMDKGKHRLTLERAGLYNDEDEHEIFEFLSYEEPERFEPPVDPRESHRLTYPAESMEELPGWLTLLKAPFVWIAERLGLDGHRSSNSVGCYHR